MHPLSFIKTQKNWVNVADFIKGKLNALDGSFKTGLSIAALDSFGMICYNESLISKITVKNDYVTLVSRFKNVKKISYRDDCFKRLTHQLAPSSYIDVAGLVESVKKECATIYDRYPLFKSLSMSRNTDAIAQYINLMDASLVEVEHNTQC